MLVISRAAHYEYIHMGLATYTWPLVSVGVLLLLTHLIEASSVCRSVSGH